MPFHEMRASMEAGRHGEAAALDVMTEPQIIRTAGGEELAGLLRAEYQARLDRVEQQIEDTHDLAIHDARKAELAAGVIALPQKVSAATLRGESRLKAIRNWHGDTQNHLHATTGIGQGYLSDLESERRTGTPETIAKRAQALNVPVEWPS